MQLYKRKEDCYGCSACMNACPKSAIHMEPDEQGFLYPIINDSLCIDCGICQKTCQIGKFADLQNQEVEICYAVKNEDGIREISSSGGVFTAILQNYSEGGVTVGATFNSEMKVIHTIAKDLKEAEAFRGSKYIQSDMQGIYKEISDILNRGEKVLFSGTPCQVAAIQNYMRIHRVRTEQLLCVDLVCHGAPSPQIWKDYLNGVENKYHSKVKNYTFRDKVVGWRGYHVRVGLEDGRSIPQNDLIQSFAVIFGKEVMVRPSCFYCPYASMKRCGDITIGDFWGIEKVDKDFSDNKGISMVLVNTPKGQKIFSEIKGNLTVRRYESDVLSQPNLRKPTDFGMDYDRFWEDYHTKGYLYVAKKYGGYGILRKVRYYKNAIKRKLMK